MCYSGCPYEHAFSGECKGEKFFKREDAHCREEELEGELEQEQEEE